MRLTSVWASSKVPRIAQTATFEPTWVTICRRWMSDTLPYGKKTQTPVPGTSEKPSRAALPVSPEVAVTIMTL